MWKPDAVKKKKERKMSNGRMERPAKLSNEKPKMIRPSMEKRPTVTEEWAKLMNEVCLVVYIQNIRFVAEEDE